jgi:hypothetical protein
VPYKHLPGRQQHDVDSGDEEEVVHRVSHGPLGGVFRLRCDSYSIGWLSDIAYPRKKKTPWLLVRKRTIPTERPPLVGEVSANFCEQRV